MTSYCKPSFKVALIGCGRISKRHSEILSDAQFDGFDLVAVCDVVKEKANLLAAKHSIPAFYSISDLLENCDFDIGVVLTESGKHAEHTLQLANARKHVIVEKPMALTLDDADNMIKVCDENNVRLFVVKQNRFNLPVQALKLALDQGRFGSLTLGTVRVRWCRPQSYYDQDLWRGTWEFDGGVLTNQASHHVDLLEWCMGPVESVTAKTITALANIETEDTAVAILKFTSGALGIIEATTATRPHDLEGSLSILGQYGSVVINGFSVNKLDTWAFSTPDSNDKFITANSSENPPDVYGFGHKAYYQHVLDCMINKKSALVDGFEGKKSLELINAIYESVETGKEVSLRFRPKQCKLGLKS